MFSKGFLLHQHAKTALSEKDEERLEKLGPREKELILSDNAYFSEKGAHTCTIYCTFEVSVFAKRLIFYHLQPKIILLFMA